MAGDACYCGHDCAKCVTYVATRTNDDALRRQAQAFYKQTFGIELPLEAFHCDGGRSPRVFALCRDCPFLSCCRERHLERCADCADYPCKLLAEYQASYVNSCNQIE